MRHIGSTVTVVAVLSSLLLAGSTVAAAEPGGTPPPEAVEPAVGSEDAVEEVAALVTSHYQEAGYGKVSVDYERATVDVLWKGDPPASVKELEGQQQGVTVTLGASVYSEDELAAAARLILDSDNEQSGEGSVSAALPNSDRSGLIVEVVEEAGPAKTTSANAARYTGLTSIPTRVEVVADSTVPTTRRNDSAPWQGGGAMAFAKGRDYCSTGFAVLLNNGQGRLLSAAHCNNAVGNTVRDGRGQVIGPISNRATGIDSELINPNASPATIGKVFGGPWNAGTGHNRYQFFVGGAAAPVNGQKVCSSGAISREHCNRTIRATGIAFYCGHARACTGFRATGPGISVAAGDSGGPIYRMRADRRVGARGIISAASGATRCGSTSEPTECYRHVYGIGIHRVLNRWNARIEQ